MLLELLSSNANFKVSMQDDPPQPGESSDDLSVSTLIPCFLFDKTIDRLVKVDMLLDFLVEVYKDKMHQLQPLYTSLNAIGRSKDAEASN